MSTHIIDELKAIKIPKEQIGGSRFGSKLGNKISNHASS